MRYNPEYLKERNQQEIADALYQIQNDLYREINEELNQSGINYDY